jgi:hypothetical protein
MMCETMEALGLTGLRETPTLLQLYNRSTRKIEGIMEDIVISIYSWEYLTELYDPTTQIFLGRVSFNPRKAMV